MAKDLPTLLSPITEVSASQEVSRPVSDVDSPTASVLFRLLASVSDRRPDKAPMFTPPGPPPPPPLPFPPTRPHTQLFPPQPHDAGPAFDFPLPQRQQPIRRLELPVFDGSDVEDWIDRIEQFFVVGAYTE
ncbi:unnamed protein product [Arabis nemorensis]|uniref:Uncharacterized protein n=1 Tax=Arabis nemorensis TaxID=586526 RepID=A0A565BMP2_9BRAS|nr:unnamed protein product [Arabis nemorensis]